MFSLLCSPGPGSSTWSRWRQTFGRKSWWSYTDRGQWAPESGHVEENSENIELQKERKVLLQQHFHTWALDNFRKMQPVHFPQSCFAKCDKTTSTNCITASSSVRSLKSSGLFVLNHVTCIYVSVKKKRSKWIKKVTLFKCRWSVHAWRKHFVQS